MKLSSFLYSMASIGTIWLPILVSMALCVLGLILKHYFPLISMRGRGLPKGSFGWPLFGETIGFLTPHVSHTVGNFLHDHITRYGKVFKSHLFFTPTVVSCDPELNYFILQNESKLFECSYPGTMEGILGKRSILVVHGETHKRLRSAAVSLVNTIKTNPHFLKDIQTATLNILDSWNDKDQIIFRQHCRKFTFNMIVKQVLGLGSEEPITIVLLDDFRTFMKGLVSIPIYIPGTPYAKAIQARARILAIIKSLIKERRRQYTSNDEKSCDHKNDFLDNLLSMDSLSEDEKSSFVVDALLGGYDTTAVLLAILVHFLSQNPSVLKQLKEEHQKIRDAKNGDELLTWEDFRKMEFTLHVIHEGLRFGNVVKFVHRKALQDVKFKDYVIPSGWQVLPVLTAVHLDSSLHSKASEFNPWRFENPDATTSKTFSPFGGGIRYCPGLDLAKIEVAFFLHYLVQNFRWTSKNGELPIAYPYVEFLDGLVVDVERISSS